MKQIDILRVPDDVLLEIFDFYVGTRSWDKDKKDTEAWQLLIHVCRRWRSLVLGSSRRLHLRLYCTPDTPTRDTLDIWPALPLIISGSINVTSNADNVIAALGRSNHVCYVHFRSSAGRQLEKVLAAMEMPFPKLKELRLTSHGTPMPVIPDSFLGGSARRLRTFNLMGIPFPGLPKLLLSATHLVDLNLSDIPHSGYISPGAMVTLLSVLSNLETLCLQFRPSQSRFGRETRPSKRSVIPALATLDFVGFTEYLEDLVTGIDTPQLDEMYIAFFNQIDFDTRRLAQFIDYISILKTRDAHVEFSDDVAYVELSPGFGILEIAILCREPDWQLSSIEQVCNSSLHLLSAVEDLYIENRYSELLWKDDAIENTLWLQLFLPFTTAKNLYLSKEFAPGIAAVLQELVGGRIIEVLPSLQNIFVEGLEPSGPFQENIGHFVAARQLSDHPIAVATWDKEST